MQLSDPELSIGVFARKSRLSMRALRLYEKMGVLKPVRVDPCTGYRWYAESQLAVARLIGGVSRSFLSFGPRSLETVLARNLRIVLAQLLLARRK